MFHTCTIDAAQIPGPGLERSLSSAERGRMAGFASPKRRHDWLLGRYAAKTLVRDYLRARGVALPLEQIVIVSEADGAPRVVLLSSLPPRPLGAGGVIEISISHSGGRAFCALSERGPIGADIERVERRGPAFAADYCTPAELELLASAPVRHYDTLLTAIWSAKEAALKVLRLGLTVDTRELTCLPALTPAADWQPVAIHTALSATPLRGWWRIKEGFVYTIAVTW